MYRNDKVSIEVQITANYSLRSEVWSTLKNPDMNPDASLYMYKEYKGVLTKEDGDINIQFLSGSELFIFGLTLLSQADKLSSTNVKKVVEGFLGEFDLSKLK